MAFLKSLATVGMGTALTRILGFLRDMAIAATLGTGPIADAFVVAFRLPNVVRRVFGEGAFNAAFIPLYMRLSARERMRFTGQVLSSFMAITLFLSVVFMVFMPFFMTLFAPGFQEPNQFKLAVHLTRLAFPFLPFMALMALLGAVLNAQNHFTATSFAPALLNIVLLCILLPFLWRGENHSPRIGEALAIGVSFAGFVQAAFLFFAVRRAHLALPFVRPRLTPRVRLLFWRSFPSLLMAGIAQINILVGTILATMQFSGVAWLYYADRLYQLPLGIIGIALGIVLLNSLTQAKNEGLGEKFLHLQNQAVLLSFMFALPASLGLYLGAEGMMSVLFERGAFHARDSYEAARALKGFAVGLPAFVLIKVFANSYFAGEEMGMPLKASLVGLGVNTALCLGFYPTLGIMGIALATSVSGYITLCFLLFPLVKRGEFYLFPASYKGLFAIFCAACVMGGVLYVSVIPKTLWALCFFIALGLLVYLLVLAFFHFLCFRVVQLKE